MYTVTDDWLYKHVTTDVTHHVTAPSSSPRDEIRMSVVEGLVVVVVSHIYMSQFTRHVPPIGILTTTENAIFVFKLSRGQSTFKVCMIMSCFPFVMIRGWAKCFINTL